ncbi:MAG: hypothetical protein ABIJ61_00080 [bacterium]
MSGSRIWLVLLVAAIAMVSQSAAALYLSLDFALDNQTYAWTDTLLWRHNFDSRNSVELLNHSQATLIKGSVFGAGTDRWQKQSRTRGLITRRLSSKVKLGLEFLQDFERLETRRFIGNGARLLAEFDWRWLRVTERLGPGWELREAPSEKDTQSGVGQEMLLELLPRRDYSFGRVTVTTEVQAVERTPHKSVGFGYELTRSFTGADTTNLYASQSFAEQKFFPSSRNFEQVARQRSELRQFDLDLRRKLPIDLYLQARSSYRLSSYKYDYESIDDDVITQNDNLRLLFDYEFRFSRRISDWLLLETEYLFDRTKDDFGAENVNQRSETGRWSAAATIALEERDTLAVSGQIGVTSYFTSGKSAIFSDRDRTLEILSVRIAHRFTPYLKGAIDGSYRGFHTIYVSGSLSANNNHNNVFLLSPSLDWRPFHGVRLEQYYKMHANYIYYDYEKSSFAGRNTLYRRANLLNRLTLSGSEATDFELEYSYRYEDFGPIRFTDQWQQQVSWDRRTHRPKIAVAYHPNRHLNFRPYAVYEVQRSYDHVFAEDLVLGRREQTEEFVRKLVGFELQWTLSGNSYIDCRLERRIQEYQNQRHQDYDTFTITLKKLL